MEFPRIYGAGVYRKAEKTFMRFPWKCVILDVCGLIWSEAYYPDGKLASRYSSEETPNQASLSLAVPGFRMNFEYGQPREDWVVMFHGDMPGYDAASHTFYWEIEKERRLPLPVKIILNSSETEHWRETFQKITELYASAIPQNQASANLLLTEVFRRFLTFSTEMVDPVEQFRKRIDADTKWEMSLEEHCNALGYGRDHLRRDFEERFKIGPAEYRTRKRLQEVVHLLSFSRLSLKEIAYEVGMKHATHLNALIRAHYGKTPSQLCRECRMKKDDERSNPLTTDGEAGPRMHRRNAGQE